MGNENWRSIIGFEHDSEGPSRDILWSPRPMLSSGASMKRGDVATLKTRDPHRAASAVKALLSTYTVDWDWPVTSALDYLYLVLGMIGDVGRTNADEESVVFKVGRGKDPVRTNLYADGVDGTHYLARACILTDWTLNVDTIQQVRAETTLASRELRIMEAAHTWEDAAPASGRLAAGKDCIVKIGGVQYPVFGWSVGFQREAHAAGLDENSVASAWGGNLTFDIGGKVTCRAPAGEFDEALTAQREDPIEATINFFGGTALKMEFPNCILQADSKRVVSPENFEYALQWSALQGADGDMATLTLMV